MDINKILINKMYRQINRYVKNKASRKAFAYYIDKLGNDKAKLKKFNSQLGNLSNTVNTLPKLFKSFTSKKRSEKIKQTMAIKQALPNYIEEEQTIKPTKEERANKRLNAIIQEEKGKREVRVRNLKKNDKIQFKQALNGTFREIHIENDNFTIEETNAVFISGELNIPIYIPNNDLLYETIQRELNTILNKKEKDVNIFTNIVISFDVFRIIETDEKINNTDVIDHWIDKNGIHYKVIIETFHYHSQFTEILQSSNQIKDFSRTEVYEFNSYMESIIKSNFRFGKINFLDIQLSKGSKTKGGSYIETPKILADKKGIVNIKNKTDDMCIIWCLLAYKYYVSFGERGKKSETSTYKKYFNEIIQPKDIKYPIDIQKDIKQFEQANNVKINVFGYTGSYDKPYDKNNLITLYNNKSRNDKVVNLLLLEEGDKQHLVWIKDLSKFLQMDYKHYKQYWCSQCLSCSFDSKEKLDDHLKLCNNHEAVRAILPEKNKENWNGDREDILKFKNYGHSFKHPFSVTVDFESTLKEIKPEEEEIKNRRRRNKNRRRRNKKTEEEEIKTHITHEHIVNSCGLKYNCIHDKYSEPIKIINNSNPEEVLKQAIETSEEYAKKSYKLINKYKTTKYLKITKEQQKEHDTITTCKECNCSFTDDNKKVIHHDHITGEYISSICSTCNLKYQYKKFLPVYIHNSKGYDGHFLIAALNKYGYKENDIISCIPSTEEKYISFSKKIKVDEYIYKGKQVDVYFEIRFVDTLAFLLDSI